MKLNSNINIFQRAFNALVIKVKFLAGRNKSNNYFSSIGILYICTGKYDIFFEPFYKSFKAKFLPDTNKTFYVFTDSEKLKAKYKYHTDIVFTEIEKKGWPYDTLLRNRYFFEHFGKFEGNDYLFFCNANLFCNDKVFLNDLGLHLSEKLCGVLHPYFFNKEAYKFPVEKQNEGNAYFNSADLERVKYYFQGCFYGGSYNNFKKLVQTICKWTEEDLSKEIIPIWHDESYLNKYFFNNPPYPLHSGYSYPTDMKLSFPPKIMNVDKAKFGGLDFLRS